MTSQMSHQCINETEHELDLHEKSHTYMTLIVQISVCSTKVRHDRAADDDD